MLMLQWGGTVEEQEFRLKKRAKKVVAEIVILIIQHSTTLLTQHTLLICPYTMFSCSLIAIMDGITGCVYKRQSRTNSDLY